MLRRVVLQFQFVVLAHNQAGADTTAIPPTLSIKTIERRATEPDGSDSVSSASPQKKR